MERDEPVISWKMHEYEFRPKTKNWYWVVGIVAGGISVAAFILGNILFGIIVLLAGFSVMLVGSRRPEEQTYSLTKRGVRVGNTLFLYEKIQRFSMVDDEPRSLSLEVLSILGTLTIPLGSADHRRVRTELKNRNIEEVESLDTFTNRVIDSIGL